MFEEDPTDPRRERDEPVLEVVDLGRHPNVAEESFGNTVEDLALVLEVVIERGALHAETRGQTADRQTLDTAAVDDLERGRDGGPPGDHVLLRSDHIHLLVAA